ncbi:MAG TPA: hypothetical protein VHG28_00865 [Longimicrobiaceae bacterium]|nr:hypothetical protein [Longimicrobiaceae bacterium]
MAKGIALALADSTLRQQVLEDMRDSPFPRHSLHLQSYLHGERGQTITTVAAKSVGLSIEEFLSLTRYLPDAEFSVSSPLDRIEWTGSSNLVVTAATMTRWQRRSVRSLPGYDVNGKSVTVPLTHKVSQAVLSILPAEFVFGPDPEAARAAAPRRGDNTISSFEREFSVQSSCDPTTAILPCESDMNSTVTVGPGYAVGSDCSAFYYRETNAANDLDHDNIKDVCEERFAVAFQPQLVRHVNEIFFAREPYWTVQLVSGGYPSIGYLLSYYYDGGSFSHHGDSEFIIITLKAGTDDYWHVYGVTPSAHWGVCCGGDETRTLGAGALQYTGSRPYVFVSKDHHGGYESDNRCDDRIGDECSPIGSGNTEPVGVYSGRNIGNSRYPHDLDPVNPGGPDCTYSKVDVSTRPGTECFLFTR